MAKTQDVLGDKIKAWESISTSRKAFVGQPIIIRIDGHSFSKWTKGLGRPYDERLSTVMVLLTKYLCEKFQCRLGYTQSDEITLLMYMDDPKSEYMFGGRFQKLDSIIAGAASSYFNALVRTEIPEKAEKLAELDCRTFVVPNLEGAYEVFYWRQLDAIKNAVSMAAHDLFSHKSLQGMNSKQMKARMQDEAGVEFDEYPAYFRMGTFVQKEKRSLTQAEIDKIPEKYRTQAATASRTFYDSRVFKLQRIDKDFDDFLEKIGVQS